MRYANRYRYREIIRNDAGTQDTLFCLIWSLSRCWMTGSFTDMYVGNQIQLLFRSKAMLYFSIARVGYYWWKILGAIKFSVFWLHLLFGSFSFRGIRRKCWIVYTKFYFIIEMSYRGYAKLKFGGGKIYKAYNRRQKFKSAAMVVRNNF